MQYANIIIDISAESLDKVFQYSIPKALDSEIKPGMRVKCPFGKGNRIIDGYVISTTDVPEIEQSRIKDIISIVTDAQQEHLIMLADWMRTAYGSTMIQALRTVLPVKKKIKTPVKKIVVLNVGDREAEEFLEVCTHKKYYARERLMKALISERRIELSKVTSRLNVTLPVVKKLEEKGIITLEKSEAEFPYMHLVPKEELILQVTSKLTREQSDVTSGILNGWKGGSTKPVLIHGVTGSGKTRVYMELIRYVLDMGQQAIVLIPEIALTYQTVMRFYHRFGKGVSFLNSKMSDGERFRQFEKAKNGDIHIMVGPRSALFSPFPNLGLIIIDEEHENTYKSEKTPRYHAIDTAIKRTSLSGGHVVLGSATPSVDSYFKAKKGEYELYEMMHRYGGSVLPEVHVVDMKAEFASGNRGIISRELESSIRERIDRQEQVILFLNRRGYASFLSCRACGEVIKCPHCDVSLSLHRMAGNTEKLLCHYCGYQTSPLKECPKCKSTFMGGFRAGTQQIEELIKSKFEDARVLRMDYDTTRSKGGHESILSSFANREADILIGTQMIVKGHDFPYVTLVGIIAADLSLYSGGFRASERTFQLITQAVGRAGRGGRQGEAIVQTYHPDDYAISCAVKQDYREFYRRESDFRALMKYPPQFCMVAVMGSSRDEEHLIEAMKYIKKFIVFVSKDPSLIVIGPAPDVVSRIKDIYHHVIYIKHYDIEHLIHIRQELERYIEINSGFNTVQIQFDFAI